MDRYLHNNWKIVMVISCVNLMYEICDKNSKVVLTYNYDLSLTTILIPL